MAEKKTVPCTNCGGSVAVRRPSKSGNHYCTASPCQSAKQRFYRGRKAEVAEVGATEERLQLVVDLASGRRAECPRCGLPDGLPGWAHGDTTGLARCFGLGPKGRAAGAAFLDAVHPSRVPHLEPEPPAPTGDPLATPPLPSA